jgi:hypothetical protein
VSASFAQEVILWDADSFRRVGRITVGTGPLMGMAVDPVGTYIACMSQSGVVSLLTLAESATRTGTGHDGKGGPTAAMTARGANRPRLYMHTTAKVSINGSSLARSMCSFFTRIAWHPSGETLAVTGLKQDNINVPVCVLLARDTWSLNDDRLYGHTKPTLACSFHARLFHTGDPTKPHSVFALTGADGNLSVWRSDERRPRAITSLFEQGVLDAAWDKSGIRLLALCCADGTASLVRYSEEELGVPLSGKEQAQVLADTYGGTHSLALLTVDGEDPDGPGAPDDDADEPDEAEDEEVPDVPEADPAPSTQQQVETRVQGGRRRIQPVALEVAPTLTSPMRKRHLRAVAALPLMPTLGDPIVADDESEEDASGENGDDGDGDRDAISEGSDSAVSMSHSRRSRKRRAADDAAGGTGAGDDDMSMGEPSETEAGGSVAHLRAVRKVVPRSPMPGSPGSGGSQSSAARRRSQRIVDSDSDEPGPRTPRSGRRRAPSSLRRSTTHAMLGVSATPLVVPTILSVSLDDNVALSLAGTASVTLEYTGDLLLCSMGWQRRLPAPLYALGGCGRWVVASDEHHVYILSASTGFTLCSPLATAGTVTAVKCVDHFILLGLSTGKVRVYNWDEGTLVVETSELASTAPLKLDLSPGVNGETRLIATVGSGEVYLYREPLRAWLRLYDPTQVDQSVLHTRLGSLVKHSQSLLSKLRADASISDKVSVAPGDMTVEAAFELCSAALELGDDDLAGDFAGLAADHLPPAIASTFVTELPPSVAAKAKTVPHIRADT